MRLRQAGGVFFAILLVAVALVPSALAQPGPPQPSRTTAATHRLIAAVRTAADFEREGIDPASARLRSEQARERIRPIHVHTAAGSEFAVLSCGSTLAASRVRNELLATGDYTFVIPDLFLAPTDDPNDPFFARQWHLERTGAPTAWGFTVGQRAVTLAIVDTGVDPTHPDLIASRVPGYNAVDHLTEAGGGLTDDINGHGTGTAGVAAAAGDNGAGVCGVLWNVRLMPVRVTNSPGGGAFLSDIIDGIGWAVGRGARVVSVSYAGVRSEGAEYIGAWVRQQGAMLVWSAENAGDSYDGFDWRNVIIVGGTDQNDRRAGFSCFGRGIDLAAPATNIFSTRRGGLYGDGSGNSYSGPQVAGTLALMLSVAPELSPSQAEGALRLACSPLTPGDGMGAGLLNVAESVRLGSRLDFNRDGFIDFFDYDGFVAAFEAGAPRSDINNDGFIDFFDYDWFIRLFESTW